MDINLIGGPFQHAHCSTWWKKPKSITYIKNKYESNISFYVDNGIKTGLTDNFTGTKYAWLLESRSFHNLTNYVIDNFDKITNTYKYIFVNDNSLLLNEQFKLLPGNGFWIEQPKIYDKSKLLSFVTSSKQQTIGHNLRIETIKKYYGKFDLFGRGFKDIKLKEEGIIDYMFSFAIENDNYDTYFSEKVLDCFATGTIPIYWGTKNICNYFNSDGIIFLDDFDITKLNIDYYNDRKSAIEENFMKVLEYEIPEDYIYKNYLLT